MLKLFVLKGCPHCASSLELVKSRKIDHEVIVVSQEEKDLYKKKHGMNTFPQVFYNRTLIGGNQDLHEIVGAIETVSHLPDATLVGLKKQL